MNKQSVGSALAIAFFAAVCWTAPPAVAASAEEILARLDALEREVATLRRENAALRQRGDRKAAPAVRPPQVEIVGATAAPAQVYAAAPVKTPVAPVPARYNWSGVYVGAHFGAGWSRTDWKDPPFFVDIGAFPCGSVILASCPTLGSHNAIGPLGGGQVGVNWQSGSLVYGLNLQYSLASLRGTHDSSTTVGTISAPGAQGFSLNTSGSQLTTKVTDIATLGGRIGLSSEAYDRTLFYVTGGAAYVREKMQAELTQQGAECGAVFCDSGVAAASLRGNHSRWGWMVGTGLEYGLVGNWSAKIEYQYLGLGTKSATLSGPSCVIGSFFPVESCPSSTSRRFSVGQDIQIIQFGLNYRMDAVGIGYNSVGGSSERFYPGPRHSLELRILSADIGSS